MRTEISIRASDPNSSSRVFAWPVLEAGNASYPNGIYSFVCEDKEPGKSFSLMHSVRGASLITEWMESGKTSFVCSVAAPRSMYKKLGIYTENLTKPVFRLFSCKQHPTSVIVHLVLIGNPPQSNQQETPLVSEYPSASCRRCKAVAGCLCGRFHPCSAARYDLQ